MKLRDFLRWALGGIAVCAVAGALVACGGGGSGGFASLGGVGTGGTGISMGTVTGFGSVIVDGTSYNSATPQYLAQTAQDEAATAPSTAVELGAQVALSLDAQGQPTVLRIAPALLGPVGAVDAQAGTFAVNGVTVHTNLNAGVGPVTYYAGLPDFGALASGMQVEVHGVWGVDAAGAGFVQATLVEQAPSTNVATRVTGVVSNLASGSFTLGGFTVHVDATTSVLPAGISLSNGALVNVWSASPPSGGVISASVIRVSTLAGSTGQVQIAGLVAGLGANGFQLSGIPVDTRALATLQGLADGRYVVVTGTVNGSNATVTANAVRAYASQVTLQGTVTGYVGLQNFQVRGVPIDASAASIQGGSAASIGNGVYVTVTGLMNGGNVLAAASVNIAAAVPDGGTVDLDGTVSAANAAAGTFTLTWQHDGQSGTTNVVLAPNVVFSNASAAQIVNGATVKIEASNTSSGFVAYTVNVLATPGSASSGGSGGTSGGASDGSGGTASLIETQGVVYNLGATSFMLNGLTIQFNGVVPTGGALVNGAHVDVSFSQVAGVNLAQKIALGD